MFLLFVFLLNVAVGDGDCILKLGEWAFEYCSKEVEDARSTRPNLVRGICEVVQDQLEKFLSWRAAQLAEVKAVVLCFAFNSLANLSRTGT